MSNSRNPEHRKSTKKFILEILIPEIISTATTVSEITDPSDAAIPFETIEEGTIDQGI